MRRADRLFQIVQIFRRHDGPITAKAMADELEVTERTIYRDIVALQSSRVPISGEAGVGYILRSGFDLPPLMFSEDELEALLLGARIVETWADPDLAVAAKDLLGKIEAVIPEDLKPLIASQALAAPNNPRQIPIAVDMAEIRRAIRQKRKVEIDYTAEDDSQSTRVIWPLSLTYWGLVWLVVGWCEMRNDFRAFRPDRIRASRPLDEHYPDKRGRRLADYVRIEESRGWA